MHILAKDEEFETAKLVTDTVYSMSLHNNQCSLSLSLSHTQATRSPVPMTATGVQTRNPKRQLHISISQLGAAGTSVTSVRSVRQYKVTTALMLRKCICHLRHLRLLW